VAGFDLVGIIITFSTIKPENERKQAHENPTKRSANASPRDTFPLSLTLELTLLMVCDAFQLAA
tara:strand:+ start:124 stop:315 length:192 start_codon:yes stop_codon:yes gene_type:complete